MNMFDVNFEIHDTDDQEDSGFVLSIDNEVVGKETDWGNAVEQAMILEEIHSKKVDIREFNGFIISTVLNA